MYHRPDVYGNVKKFGQLPQRQLPAVIYDPVMHQQFDEIKKKMARPTAERVAAWTSYFTMVYAAIIGLAPQTAVAAVLSVKTVIG